uniref:Uncharacterized protein n=1 Tax=viral metagenome TaxID=1070528 RepID=A0A6M3JU45_9ZZZZ
MDNLATWTPRKVEAAKAGNESIYYKCCECGSDVTAGAAYRGEKFIWNNILVKPIPGSPFVNPAIYCQTHLPETIK